MSNGSHWTHIEHDEYADSPRDQPIASFLVFECLQSCIVECDTEIAWPTLDDWDRSGIAKNLKFHRQIDDDLWVRWFSFTIWTKIEISHDFLFFSDRNDTLTVISDRAKERMREKKKKTITFTCDASCSILIKWTYVWLAMNSTLLDSRFSTTFHWPCKSRWMILLTHSSSSPLLQLFISSIDMVRSFRFASLLEWSIQTLHSTGVVLSPEECNSARKYFRWRFDPTRKHIFILSKIVDSQPEVYSLSIEEKVIKPTCDRKNKLSTIMWRERKKEVISNEAKSEILLTTFVRLVQKNESDESASMWKKRRKVFLGGRHRYLYASITARRQRKNRKAHA